MEGAAWLGLWDYTGRGWLAGASLQTGRAGVETDPSFSLPYLDAGWPRSLGNVVVPNVEGRVRPWAVTGSENKQENGQR